MSLNFEIFKNKLSESHKLNIKYKDTSLFMKILSYLLFFNKDFMTNYVTTIGSTVYFPTRSFVDKYASEAIQTLAHEFVHVKDCSKNKILFNFRYLFPQILSIFSLLAILFFITPYFLFSLLFLLFALPLPSPPRSYYELRGYQMTLYMVYLYLKYLKVDEDAIKLNLEKNIEIISKYYFAGPAYYYMNMGGSKKELTGFMNKILSGEAGNHDEMYVTVTEAFESCKEKSKIP